ncbi:MAG: hypothetical protein ACYTEL_07370 [Planctomycetota bacterium]|jgi:CheY-like chemotaxis protein
MLKTIAFVDDDAVGSRFYIKSLEATGNKVTYFRTVGAFLKAVGSDSRFDLYIVDLMMAPGKTYLPEETDEGVSTGLRLTIDICAVHPDAPIFVISNLNVDQVLQEVRKAFHEINNIVFLRKSETPPDLLAELAEKALTGGLSSLNKKSLFAKIIDLIVLQPNLFGMGVDLKKLRSKRKKS